MRTRRKNITLTEKTMENLEYLSARLDITNHSDIMRSAVQHYVDDIRKQESKISLYTKKGSTKQNTVAKKNPDNDTEMKMICESVFDGTVCDKDGVANEYGGYCKYVSYQKLSDNIMSKDVKIQPLEVLEDFTDSIYLNTSEEEVKNFDGKIIS